MDGLKKVVLISYISSLLLLRIYVWQLPDSRRYLSFPHMRGAC